MKFNRNILTELERCYSVACMDINEKPHAFFASEGRFGCYAFSCSDYTDGKTVWDQPGGTMSIVKIPGKKGEFLAGQKFFKMFDWEEAEMVWVKTLADGSF